MNGMSRGLPRRFAPWEREAVSLRHKVRILWGDFLPGGGIDYGEIPQEGLQREVKDECDLNIEVSNPLAVNTYYIKEVQRIEITFFCKVIDVNYSVRLSHEHSDYKWINVSQINRVNVSSYIKNIVKACKDLCG